MFHSDRYEEEERRKPDYQQRPILARRRIVDLLHHDQWYINEVSKAFEVDYYKDGRTSRDLREFISITTSDIVSFFTVNPETLYGSIQLGPAWQSMEHLEGLMGRLTPETQEDIDHAYKTYAVHLFHILADDLDQVQTRAIDLGYSDIECKMMSYSLGHVVLRIEAINPL